MKDEDLIQTLRTASESQNNIPLKMLLTIAAERLEQFSSNPTVAYAVSDVHHNLLSINPKIDVEWSNGVTELVKRV